MDIEIEKKIEQLEWQRDNACVYAARWWQGSISA